MCGTPIFQLGYSLEESRINALTVIAQILQENVDDVKINIIELANNLTEKELLSPLIIPIIKRLPEGKVSIHICI